MGNKSHSALFQLYQKFKLSQLFMNYTYKGSGARSLRNGYSTGIRRYLYHSAVMSQEPKGQPKSDTWTIDKRTWSQLGLSPAVPRLKILCVLVDPAWSPPVLTGNSFIWKWFPFYHAPRSQKVHPTEWMWAHDPGNQFPSFGDNKLLIISKTPGDLTSLTNPISIKKDVRYSSSWPRSEVFLFVGLYHEWGSGLVRGIKKKHTHD